MPKTMTFERDEYALIRTLLQKEVDRCEKALQRVEAAVDAGKKNTSRLIVRFAVGYQGYHQAVQEGNENGTIVYQDMLVDAADQLGIKNEEMHGLEGHRLDVKAREEEFLRNYRERTTA